MASAESTGLRRSLEALKRHGVLLQSDPKLPSISSLVAGDTVRGSWWAHPAGHASHRVVEEMDAHPDVIVSKLVSGKVTYVHRCLWSAFVGAASAHEHWQLEGISRLAQSILDRVTRAGELRTDDIPWTGGRKAESPGEVTRELERKLLIHSEEMHTSSGAHAKRLETWEGWAQRVGFADNVMTPGRAKKKLENVLRGLNSEFGASGRLPWA